MLDGQCPRVVETREPATETALEDALARNLSIRSFARARLSGVCRSVFPLVSAAAFGLRRLWDRENCFE